MAKKSCPDCSNESLPSVDRRKFLKASGAVLAASAWPVWAVAKDSPAAAPESLVKTLYNTLSDKQKKDVCFAWDFQHPKMGLLRTRVANNWHITEPTIVGDYYNDEQRALIRQIFEGIIQPDWHAKIDKQLDDDAGGYGHDQNIAIFGDPNSGKSEFVMTGRHMTLRCDGDSAEHVAFGGPIFYGHDAEGTFDEKPDHPGNVFWHQALEANKVFEMLDGKQRKVALLKQLPVEQKSGFRPKSEHPGLRVSDMTHDQKAQTQKTLATLLEPYRQSDQDEVAKCLKAQGGLDACSLSFYSDGDVGKDGVWDCWRLEGPSFVWYFRGAPHVHVWVNIADSPDVKLNA